jgi:predicted RNase H-like nuclease (RuvC/YqgF family)
MIISSLVIFILAVVLVLLVILNKKRVRSLNTQMKHLSEELCASTSDLLKAKERNSFLNKQNVDLLNTIKQLKAQIKTHMESYRKLSEDNNRFKDNIDCLIKEKDKVAGELRKVQIKEGKDEKSSSKESAAFKDKSKVKGKGQACSKCKTRTTSNPDGICTVCHFRKPKNTEK